MSQGSHDDGKLDYETLDPGIRDVVRMMRERGFDTTDSGDGHSKDNNPEALPFAHVFAMTTYHHVTVSGFRLRDLAKAQNWDATVEARWSPHDNTWVLMLCFNGPRFDRRVPTASAP